MNARSFVELVASIELRNPPFPIRIEAEETERGVRVLAVDTGASSFCPGGAVLMIAAEVRNRDTGVPSAIQFNRAFSGAEISCWDASAVVEVVRRELHKMATHEMDECLHAFGRRVFDPHRREPTIPMVMKLGVSFRQDGEPR